MVYFRIWILLNGNSLYSVMIRTSLLIQTVSCLRDKAWLIGSEAPAKYIQTRSNIDVCRKRVFMNLTGSLSYAWTPPAHCKEFVYDHACMTPHGVLAVSFLLTGASFIDEALTSCLSSMNRPINCQIFRLICFLSLLIDWCFGSRATYS